MAPRTLFAAPIMWRTLVVVIVVVIAAAGAGCAVERAPARHDPDALRGPADVELLVPGFDKRNYLLHLPTQYDGTQALPVVLALHGGGGHNSSARRTTCPDGDENSDGCLDGLADKEGFAVVYPNGSPGPILDDIRTWNAGGGAAGFQCVSGQACKDEVDEVAYFDALHAELVRALNVDTARVYATGLSNGAAMAERLACERSTRFAAVASVGGGNQVSTVQGCQPARGVPVLEIHGTKDPCWAFEQGSAACLQDDNGIKIGVAETVAGWVERNGCFGDVVTETLTDSADDGTSASRQTHGGCFNGADVVLLKVEGGGHTWPGGDQYAGEDTVGKVSHDFQGNDAIWDFFKAHPLASAE